MVARNQHGGSGGWDDLPPRILDRIRPAGSAAGVGVAPPPARPARRPGWLRDVSRLAFVFLLVAVLNLFVLLLALWFVHGGPPPSAQLRDPIPAH